MAFVLLLLLSISTLVRVETATADNSIRQLSAKQNALLGLNVALGDLQKHVGPDQRVTASARIFEPSNASETSDVRQPRWLGVWDSGPILTTASQRDWDSQDSEYKLDAAQAWLVSGIPDPTDSTAPTPKTGVSGDTVFTFPGGLDGEPELKVLKAEITGTGDAPSGYFAFGVQDESERARINLSDPHRETSDQLFSAQIAQNTAPRVVSTALATLTADQLERASSVEQIEGLSNSVDPLIWDFSTRSASVLSNPVLGGLKRDLTPLLTAPGLATSFGSIANTTLFPDGFRTDDERFLWVINAGELSDEVINGDLEHPNAGTLGEGAIYGPRWEAIWDFANLGRIIDGEEAVLHEPMTGAMANQFGGSEPTSNRKHFTSVFLPETHEVVGSSNSKESEVVAPYEAMALGDSFTAKSAEVDPEHLLVNSAVTPVLTEIVFFVTLEVNPSADPPLSLKVHPFLEMTNPYDVPLRVNNDFMQSVYLINLMMDFRLVDTSGINNDLVWSESVNDIVQVNDSATYERIASLYRSLGMLWSGELEKAASNMVVHLTIDSPVVMAAGETVGFVAKGADAVAGRFELEPGTDWWDESFTIPVKNWVLTGANTLHDPNSPYYDPNATKEYEYSGSWPSAPLSLSDFDRIEAKVYTLPYLWSGPNVVPVKIHMVSGSQSAYGAGFMGYRTTKYVVPGDRIGENSTIPSGSVFFNEFSRDLSAGSEDLAVWQIRALSGNDFDGSADVPNEGRDKFLGRTNLRALTMHGSTGYTGLEMTHTPGWTFTIHQVASGSLELQAAGWGEGEGSTAPTPLFHIPRTRPVSLGQFRHANLGFGPGELAYPILESELPNSALDRNETVRFFRGDSYTYEVNNPQDLDYSNTPYFDSADLYKTDFVFDATFYNNRVFFDNYFISTAPTDPRVLPWPNARMLPLGIDEPDFVTAISDTDSAGARLLLEGGFNVNSTSEKAWGALLASRFGLAPNGSNGTADQVDFARMSTLITGSDEYQNIRGIDIDLIYQDGQEDDTAIDTLSKRIVEQVRERGPFLSLGHFINRLLVDDSRGESGAIQAALRALGINAGQTNDYSIGSVTQGDVLEPLVPTLVTRGDTFTIRSMGESVDPVSGTSMQRMCEATVQRVPDFVIADADLPETPLVALTDPVNIRFGRQFRVIDFRWVSE
ncbi:hypothetical protein ACWPKO_15915 [Coraliomargarita sp. W4R53]